MRKYRVLVREVHIRTVEVVAESEKDAIDRVHSGEGDGIDFEYSHTMSIDTWTVEIPEAQEAGRNKR